MDSEAQFLFITCQVGAEPAIKNEFARRWPDFRFAYSRPGFLTFKLPPPYAVPDDFDPQAVFARVSGTSLGKVTGEADDELAARRGNLEAGRGANARAIARLAARPPRGRRSRLRTRPDRSGRSSPRGTRAQRTGCAGPRKSSPQNPCPAWRNGARLRAGRPRAMVDRLSSRAPRPLLPRRGLLRTDSARRHGLARLI